KSLLIGKAKDVLDIKRSLLDRSLQAGKKLQFLDLQSDAAGHQLSRHPHLARPTPDQVLEKSEIAVNIHMQRNSLALYVSQLFDTPTICAHSGFALQNCT